MLTSRVVVVRQAIQVEIDEAKFTPEFMADFREYMYQFDTVEAHVEHLAQLYARGIVGDSALEFIEGYGPVQDFGIRFKTLSVSEEIDD